MLLVDTNVLLEATDEGRTHHTDARTLVESGPRLVLAAQVIREYLVVATRPVDANGLGLTSRQALENLREFRRDIRLLPEEKPVLPTFLDLVDRTGCTGKRIHDAHIVATAKVHGVDAIVSLNVGDLSGVLDTVAVMTPGQALARGGAPRRRGGTRARGARPRR